MTGTETCIDSGFVGATGYGVWSGICVGQILPSSEICDDSAGLDEDCNSNIPTGGSNCGDPICSTHSSCIAPTISNVLADSGSESLVNNIPHTLTIMGSGFSSNFNLIINGLIIPPSWIAIATPNQLTVNLPPLTPIISSTLSFMLRNLNSPNPNLDSNTFISSLSLDNPSPFLYNVIPNSIADPNNPTGYSLITLNGDGFMQGSGTALGTDIEITFPSYLGLPPVLFSALGLSPNIIDDNTIQILVSDVAFAGTYSVRAVNPGNLANHYSVALPFTVYQTGSCSTSSQTPISGCPQLTSFIVSNPGPNGAVLNRGGTVVVSGSGLNGEPFGVQDILHINSVPIVTTLNLQTIPTLIGSVPDSIIPGTYALTVVNMPTGAISNSLFVNVYEQNPLITSITPASVPSIVASGILVIGSGFYQSSLLGILSSDGISIFGGSSVFVSPTRIDYTLPAGLQYGNYLIRITNPGGAVSSDFVLPVNAVCGNGFIEESEICDDGGSLSGDISLNGDGCSSVCQIEPGYICNGQPSICRLSSGGSDGGGGGRGSGRRTPQCNDGKDNDNDNLIDYPEDPGCSSKVDTSELNVPLTTPISTPINNQQDISLPQTPDLDLSKKDSEKEFFIKNEQFRLVYWSVVLILSSGILVIVILIIRSLRMRARFIALASKMTLPNN
jgi:cysteine-rich repeat protein